MNESQVNFEPNVVAAIWRYWKLVLLLVVVGGLIGLGATQVIPKSYTGTASVVIAPLPASLSTNSTSTPSQSDVMNQQVTLLQSPDVASQAAKTVNSKLHPRVPITGDDITSGLVVTPPTTSTSGGGSSASNGSNPAAIVQVSLGGPHVAAAATNAVVAAFQQSLAQQIRTQAQATIAGIDSTTTALNGQLNSITSQLSQLTDKEAAAQAQQQQQVQAELNAGQHPAPSPTPPPNPQIQSLTTQQQNLAGQISDLSKTRSQIQVNEALDLGYRPVTLPAVAPSSPSNDSKVRYGGIGVIVGLIVGIIAAYALAVRRRRFEDVHDPERFYGAPLLADVPVYTSQANGTGVALPIITSALKEEAESFRSIATSLRTLKASKPPLVVVFTSPRRGAGKTTVVANCGIALAQMGERVLVVDADPVRRSLTRVLADPKQHGDGLSAVIKGATSVEKALVPTQSEPNQLFILTPGDSAQVVHRWHANALSDAMVEASSLFDFVLIDVPPMGEVSYAADVVAAVGKTILVVPHHDRLTSQDQVVQQLRLTGIELIGYVYNRAPRRKDFSPYYPGEGANGTGTAARERQHSEQLADVPHSDLGT